MPVQPWTAPNYNPDLTPAAQTSRISIHGGGNPLAHLTNPQDQIAAAGQGVLSAAAQMKAVMDKRKTDAIARELLQQGATPQEAITYAGMANVGLPAANIYQKFASDQAKANQSPDPAMDDLQYRKAYADTTRAENAAYGGGPDESPGFEPVRQNGLVQVSPGRWIKDPTANAKPLASLSDEMKKTTGGSLGEWSGASNRRTEGDMYKADVTTAAGGTRTLAVPKNLGDLYLKRAAELGAVQFPQDGGTDSASPDLMPEQQAPNSAPPQDAATPPQAAIDHLKAHPELAAAFDAKYGAGSSTQFLQ